MITKFIPLIQLTPYSKTTLTKKDPLTINKRFLPSDKIVIIAQKVGPLTSVAMLTHSDIHGGVPFSKEDIDGNKRIQYCKVYEKSHETSKDSADIEKDKARTEQLKKITLTLMKNEKQYY